jgi:putative transposase
MQKRKPYATDLSDAEWGLLEPLVPAVRTGGRPAKYPRREIMNAILYVLRSGCAWRLLPHDFPPWDSVYGYFNQWRKAGKWQQIHDALYEQLRVAVGRHPQASAGIADTQSVKTTEKGA